MHATLCSKYVPKRSVDDKDDAVKRLAHVPIKTEKPPAPKIRAEIEPPTTNLTLYGVSKDPANPHKNDPQTFAARDWKSVTKSHFPPVKPDGFIGKELQQERANFMRSSDVTIGNRDQPPLRRTQFKDDYPKYERNRYMDRSQYNIGGPHNKQHSDVVVAGEEAEGRYEPMLHRQFQKLPIDKDLPDKEAAMRKSNKADMMASHFNVGRERVEYRPVAFDPIPTTNPKIKNRPPSAVSADRNPHAVRSAEEARPDAALRREAFLAKNKSEVPVLQPGKRLEANSTTTSDALPRFAKHRDQQVGTQGQTFGSSVNFGMTSGPTDWMAMTKSQFRGIYYK